MNPEPRCGRCGDPLPVVLGAERIERGRAGRNLCEDCEREVEEQHQSLKRVTLAYRALQRLPDR